MSTPAGGRRRSLRAAARRLAAGEAAAAEKICRRLLGRCPEEPEALHLLGIAANLQGDLEGAADCLERAVAARPEERTFVNSLGIVRMNQRQLAEAESAHRRALALDPDFAEAHFNLGNVLDQAGRPKEAVAAYREALARRPDYAEAALNQGIALMAVGELAAAAAILRRSLEIRPELAQAYSQLGQIHLTRGEHHEALTWLRQAVTVAPEFYDGWLQLGGCHHAARQYEEAAAVFRQAVALEPEKPAAHLNLGMTLLQIGDFVVGWREYEWRWRRAGETCGKPGCPAPIWDGAPLAGRRILLVDEQGLGDTLHFIRFAPLVQACGGVVVAECQPPLYRLLASCSGIDELYQVDEAIPEVELQIPLASLPRVLGTTLDTLPAAVPYLAPPTVPRPDLDRALVAAPGELRVGIVWAGNPCHPGDVRRSLAVEHLAPLADLPGVRLFSLQFGPRSADLRRPGAPRPIVDLGPVLGDLANTAAIVERLDLVITVDTVMAHLVGALGRPVWTLLHFAHDWRWLQGREDTPWYPTMRLFRQPHPGDWPAVASAVAQAVRNFNPRGDLA